MKYMKPCNCVLSHISKTVGDIELYMPRIRLYIAVYTFVNGCKWVYIGWWMGNKPSMDSNHGPKGPCATALSVVTA